MSQEAKILEYLKTGESLSPLDALRQFGCLRLAARVYELRDRGHDVKTVIMEENGKRYAVYYL